ncbi:hypothetical protein CLOSBL3_20549 [Clostridiaceae bacterium BL-3]|nr:hypothetical protein CLOSBL3_20549 [Clostridiaceae bacterium BL-3]
MFQFLIGILKSRARIRARAGQLVSIPYRYPKIFTVQKVFDF